jgi:hypothetical protein
LGVNLPTGALIADGMLQLLPTVDVMSSDGFFAAVMVRDAAAVDAVVEGEAEHIQETGAATPSETAFE